jgi:5-methyltetrahydrofolate--homocysteine methyltransferase
MKKAVAHVEKYLEKKEGVTKGKVILATVYGDVHDIGKNLVKTILANNGYTVFDLGKQVPANVIIDKAIEVKADAIGLSALLVSTSKQMPLIVGELYKRQLGIPVLIGGAAINRQFGRRILFVDDGIPYEAGVFYCKDAFEGLESIDKLQNPLERGDFVGRIVAEATTEIKGKKSEVRGGSTVRSEVSNHRVPIPTPPSLGARVIDKMPLEFVFECLDKDELFRLSWGAKNAHGTEWEKLKAEFEERLATMKRGALREKWLTPKAVYGYWQAQSDGESLIIYEPKPLNGNAPKEMMRFTFPRQDSQDHLCLADYFAPVDSGVMDVVAFQVVTVGGRATELFDEHDSQNEYGDAYFLHGLAVQTAEATAEYVHRHIKRELGLAPNRGKRYSWGYPAIPDLEDHAKIFKLLPAEKELGMSLSAAYQLIPEQSTAAIIVHHPEAKYYAVGGNRVEQIERAMRKS